MIRVEAKERGRRVRKSLEAKAWEIIYENSETKALLENDPIMKAGVELGIIAGMRACQEKGVHIHGKA